MIRRQRHSNLLSYNLMSTMFSNSQLIKKSSEQTGPGRIYIASRGERKLVAMHSASSGNTAMYNGQVLHSRVEAGRHRRSRSSPELSPAFQMQRK